MMRLAILQSNPTIGGLRENWAWLESKIRENAGRADLFVSPEQALSGYPARDLWAQKTLQQNEAQLLAAVAQLSAELGVGILLGHSELRTQGDGKKLHNVASLFDAGELVGRVRKERIPAYDIFEEERFFEPWRGGPQAPLNFRGKKISVMICEDAWHSVRAFGVRDIRNYPPRVENFSEAELIINLSASPYSISKRSAREDLFSSLAQRHAKALLYVNSAGGQDGVLFDGASFAMNADGELAAQAAAFREEVLIVDWQGDSFTPLPRLARAGTWAELYSALSCGLRDFVRKSGAKKVLLGMSGGIDSAFCAALAAEALGPENVLGVSLPSAFTSELSRRLARESAEKIGFTLREIPIQKTVDEYQNLLGLARSGLAYENLQSRARSVLLMGLANSEQRLLLSTTNKSELALGYGTLYGDLAGALAPLGDLYKTEVYGLAHWLNARAGQNKKENPVPVESLMRAPSAELAAGQKDNDALPDYEILDGALLEIIENQGETWRGEKGWDKLLQPKYTVKTLREKIFSQEFKRKQAPPILKVHQRSLGPGWLSPVVLDKTLGSPE